MYQTPRNPRLFFSLVVLASLVLLSSEAQAQAQPDDPVTVTHSIKQLDRQPDMFEVSVLLDIDKGWYVYAASSDSSNIVVTTIDLSLPAGVQALSDWQLPRSRPYARDALIYEGANIFTRTIKISPNTEIQDLELRVKYQACTDTSCLRPIEITIRIPVPSARRSREQLRHGGAFGFPQQNATVVCDHDDLRVSVWSNAEFFVMQALVWSDTSKETGETRRGQEIGDRTTLYLDLDANGKRTPERDRNYHLNPWPERPGLHYTILHERGTSKLKDNSGGRASIRYLKSGGNQDTRVDTIVVPLKELECAPGDTIRFAVLVKSPTPNFAIASTNETGRRPTYPEFHKYVFAAPFDVKSVPFGRDDPVPATRPQQDPPAIGAVPPEIFAASWLNTDTPHTLKELRGNVVLIDFWGTWCMPCVKGIPALNILHAKYKDKGFKLIGMTDQSKAGIERFIEDTPMHYILGTGSELAADYGVFSYPYAYLIGKDGTLLWRGSPSDHDALEARIVDALK